MLVYNIGISAIQANQAALSTISNNIANANTEGYHRQRVDLAQSAPIVQEKLQYGTGVTVQSIQRMVNSAADSALTLNLSQSADAQAQLDALQGIEGVLSPSDGSLTGSVTQYFDSVEQLATNPGDGTLRRGVVAAAQSVAQQITSFNSSLDQLQQQQAAAVNDTVKQVNSLTAQIAAVNKQIQLSQAGGTQPATLLDQRDQLIQNLGQLVDISPGSLDSSKNCLVAAGGWLVVDEKPQQLSVSRATDGSLQIFVGSRGPITPASGKLAGLLTAHNETIPAVRASMQEWSGAFIGAVNSIQATGLGLTGPVSFVNGTNSISDPTVPLARTNSLFPATTGDLSISVTDSSTGARQTFQIHVDPHHDSLNDVVGRIDALAHVQASVSTAGTVRIAADSGYAIDFAGRPDTTLDTSGVAGTAQPRVTGTYQGASNANWTVTADGSGQIGSTDPLNLRITDSATGTVIGVVNVGNGYQANQPIPIADGISLQLGPGTLTAGDHFAIRATSNPDTAGLLNTLGIGGLFQTGDLRSVSVNSSIAQNPSLLAASRNGDVGDASQLGRIAQFRQSRILSSGSETVEDRLASITSNAGVDVNFQQARLTQLQSQQSQLRDQQDAVSGVDPNEELLAMLQFQRSFQANAKFISTVNSTLDDLLELVK